MKEALPYIAIGILSLFVFVLLAKIYFLREAMREIARAFQERLSTETNTLIGVSSRDPSVLELAEAINGQLRLLRSKRHRFQQGDQELKEAITNLSHDLRTPLTAIQGYLDLLDREEKSESVEGYLAHIRNRTEALKDLTEELFHYSLATSVQTLTRERMDLVGALEESLVSFYAVMKEKGLVPEIELPQEPVWRELNRGAVNRIFSNIISNAVKYAEGDLSVQMKADGTILFSNAAGGLDPVTVGRLFDRFYTVQAGRNATGLGLSIAQVLVRRLGGMICADYQEGRLVITVRL